MKTDKNNSIGRFRIIFLLICVVGMYVMGSALHTMLNKSDYWTEVSKRFVKENLPIPAARGNIYDAQGRLMAGSVPAYRLYFDYVVIDRDSVARVKAQHWRDSVFDCKLDSIAMGLAKIFPRRDAAWFRNRLLEGKKIPNNHAWRLYPYNASYIQYRECLKLPLLREPSFKGGFHVEPIMQRKHPYGSLAYRMIGDLWRDTDAAKNGLELKYDKVLRGKNGLSHRMRVRNKRVSFVDVEPQHGHDLVTTIDVDIQDFAEKTLRSKLKEKDVNGDVGMAIVMDVPTGDVKAIVNLQRADDGEYYEMKNNAVSDLMEPGSTFKTASIMVALEDGKITLDTEVDCTGGVYNMHGRKMKDHNWRNGGYGVLKVPDILGYSSNIGVSRIIENAYAGNPKAFIDGLLREGVGIPLNLPFPGKGEPILPRPGDPKRYWSKTDLPWMSIGYVTQLPPISTLTFYNAIANGGKMVKPRFVKYELSGGEIVKEYPVEVIKERICKPSTLADIQYCLEYVVSTGLGRKAGCKYFKVSGKTGTAQVASAGGGGYHSGVQRYMVSFCGYFPSDNPRYSCIVCIVKNGLPASGGGQCGPVFSKISQYIMAQGNMRKSSNLADSTSVFVQPEKKARSGADSVALQKVPDVRGMGARDAVFVLRKRGLKVSVQGEGSVTEQSIPAGSEVVRGSRVTIKLK